MQLLTVKQYAINKKITEQAVYKSINEGRIKPVLEPRYVRRIPVDENGNIIVVDDVK